MSKVIITELALRDAHQSLFATRMLTADMLPIAAQMDKVGYGSIEAWGGATFDSCIRFLNEDPWERIRKLKAAMPKTPMQMLLRGQNLLGYRHYADDMVETFVARAAANGVDVFRVFDALNDVRNLEASIRAVRKAGKHAQATISYAISPVHTPESYVELARRLQAAGAESICLKDMAGLLKPYEAFTLVAALRKAIDVPVQIHSHATTGMSVATLVKSVEAGALLLDTAISSLAMGTSHSPTETMVEVFKGTPYDTGLDTALLVEIAAYFRDVRRKYRQFESAFAGADTRILISQVPGGMLSNLESQLKEQGAGDKLDKVLHEIAVVQKDFGYPPLVTPTSQIVGTQAVLNVLFGRYERISNESRDLLVGNYGATPARPNEELVRKALIDAKLSAPVVTRPADAIPNEMGKIEKELCEKLGRTNVPVEDVLTYAMFPQVAVKFFQTRAKGPVTFDAPTAESAAPKSAGPRAYTVTVDGADYAVSEDGGKLSVNGQAFAVNVKEGAAAAAVTPAPADGEGSQLLAPMPGVVIKFECKDGEAVQAGQSVLILEALKMQMPVKTRTAGRIKFRVHPGDHVRGDAVLADLV